MKKRILAGVLASAAALTAVSFSGCNNNEEGGGNGGDGDVLTLLAWSGNTDVQAMIDYFCEQTGTDKSKIKWAQVGSKGEESRDQYKTYLDGDQDADLIFCDAEWAPVYANDDKYTADLSTIGIDKSSYPNAYEYTLAFGTNDAGKFRGATWQATPGGFVYRADYAEQYLGVKTPDEMQALVKDWDTFEQTADKLAKEHGVALVASEGGLWQVKQCEKKSPWVVDGKLVIDDDAKDFMNMVKKYVDNGYVSSATQWDDQTWYPTVQTGKALGDFAPTWGLTNGDGTIANNFSGGKDGVMGLCEGPAKWYWGGTFMEVTAKCNSKDLAKQWIEFFTINEDSMKGYSLKTGDYMNNKSVMKDIVENEDPANPLTNPMYKDGIHQFKTLYKSAEGINLSATKYDSVIKGEFNQAVQDYAINKKTSSVDEAIEAFKKGVGETYKELV